MNIPINCPICGDPLTNTFNDTTEKVIYKNCRLRSSHIFSCAVFLKGFWSDQIDDVVDRVSFTLSMNPILSVEIHPDSKLMLIGKSAPGGMSMIGVSTVLPFYVEPDFSDYGKLIRKIKTYLLFS